MARRSLRRGSKTMAKLVRASDIAVSDMIEARRKKLRDALETEPTLTDLGFDTFGARGRREKSSAGAQHSAR
jgi:hypothetical protein